MYKFANVKDKERELVFRRTASKLKLSEAIVEKDFWVCWMLDYMFTKFKFRVFLTSKGGTSLSKAFHMIERFSEDIDLVLNWNAIGIDQDEPYIERSHNQQEAFN